MAFVPYSSGLLTLADGSTAFASADHYAVLLDDSYTPSLAHSTYSDVSGSEIADGDYDPVALTTKSVAIDSTEVLYDCDDIAFGDPVTISAQFCVIVKGTAATPQAGDAIIGYEDFGEIKSSTASEFTVRTTTGLLRLNRPA